MQTMQKKKVIRHSKHFLSLLLSHKHKRTIIGSYVVGFLKKKKLNHGFEMLLRAIRESRDIYPSRMGAEKSKLI